MKRISADGSVGLPHVRVGHCQVPLRRTRLTAGFLRLAERINWGQSTLLLYTSEHSYTLVPSADKSEKCTLTPLLTVCPPCALL